MTLQFTAEITVGAVSSTSVVAKILVGFRNCRDGEILVKNQCAVCPTGTYSLKYDASAQCTACPSTTDACAERGLVDWTKSPYPLTHLPCPLAYHCSMITTNMSSYGSFLAPASSFALTDYYGNLNRSDSDTVVTVSAVQPTYCGLNRIGYVSGLQLERVKKGVVTFDSMSVFCFPGGNMTVQFQALMGQVSSTLAKITYRFRECRNGEILVNNQCLMCPSGTFSIKFDPKATQCTACPAGAEGCDGGKIKPAKGFWRLSPLSTTMMKCPFPKACGGKKNGRRLQAADTAVDDNGDLCAEGYGGPLCGVCSAGYYLSTAAKACASCAGQGTLQLVTLVVVPLVLLIIMYASILYSDDQLNGWMQYFKPEKLLAMGVRAGDEVVGGGEVGVADLGGGEAEDAQDRLGVNQLAEGVQADVEEQFGAPLGFRCGRRRRTTTRKRMKISRLRISLISRRSLTKKM